MSHNRCCQLPYEVYGVFESAASVQERPYRGLPAGMFDFQPTMSQRVGTAAVCGAYGETTRLDEALIKQAFSPEGLTDDQIMALEALRNHGAQERFGPGGRFGYYEAPKS